MISPKACQILAYCSLYCKNGQIINFYKGRCFTHYEKYVTINEHSINERLVL